MQSIMIEWEAVRMAIEGWVRSGRTMTSLSQRADVSRGTLLNWLDWEDPPDTVVKAARVMEVIENERAGTTEG